MRQRSHGSVRLHVRLSLNEQSGGCTRESQPGVNIFLNGSSITSKRAFPDRYGSYKMYLKALGCFKNCWKPRGSSSYSKFVCENDVLLDYFNRYHFIQNRQSLSHSWFKQISHISRKMYYCNRGFPVSLVDKAWDSYVWNGDFPGHCHYDQELFINNVDCFGEKRDLLKVYTANLQYFVWTKLRGLRAVCLSAGSTFQSSNVCPSGTIPVFPCHL